MHNLPIANTSTVSARQISKSGLHVILQAVRDNDMVRPQLNLILRDGIHGLFKLPWVNKHFCPRWLQPFVPSINQGYTAGLERSTILEGQTKTFGIALVLQ